MAFYPISPTSPTVEPITLQDAKLHLRVQSDDEDSLIETYVKAARAHVEARTGVMYGSRDITAYCDGFGDLSALPFAPVAAVTSIKYTDADGAQQTVPDTVYVLNSDGTRPSIALKAGQSWPAASGRVELIVTAGGALPNDVREAMLVQLSIMEDRGRADAATIAQMMAAVRIRLANHRRFGF